MDKRVTLADIARATGYSKGAISLALKNDLRVAEATRERIQQAARELGYQKNALVANLMAQLRASRTPQYQSTLGFLNPTPHRNILNEVQTFKEWARGVQSRSEELGYGLNHFWLGEPGLSDRRMLKILQARGIRGVVVGPLLNEGVLPEEFGVLWRELACVALGKLPFSPLLHAARNDQYDTGLQAVLHAARLGYRKPALVVARKVDENVGLRFSSGYAAGCLRASLEPLAPFPFTEACFPKFRDWFRRERPDVLITAHAMVKDWLEADEVAVPADVGLLSLDCNEAMAGWAGMCQNNDLIGAAAVDLLVGQLHRNEVGSPAHPMSILIRSSFRNGDTVAAPPAEAPRAIPEAVPAVAAAR